MRLYLVRVLSLSAPLLWMAACEPTPGPEDAGASRVEAADVLAAARSGWVAAYNAGDAEALARYFADDAVLLPAGEPARSGRPAVDAYLEQMLGEGAGTLEIVSHEVRSSGGLAVDRAAYAVAEGDGAARRTGKYVMVWQRDAEGAWKIVWDIWNGDARPPAPPADTAAVER